MPNAFLLLGAAVPLVAQVNSNVQATVTDPNGGAIPSASTQLENTQTGVRSESKTENSGLYRFSGVIPGDYQVTADANGFSTGRVIFRVTTDQTAGVNLVLKGG